MDFIFHEVKIRRHGCCYIEENILIFFLYPFGDLSKPLESTVESSAQREVVQGGNLTVTVAKLVREEGTPGALLVSWVCSGRITRSKHQWGQTREPVACRPRSYLYPTIISPPVPGHSPSTVPGEERIAALTHQQWEVASTGQVDPLRSPLGCSGPCLGQASRIRVH